MKQVDRISTATYSSLAIALLFVGWSLLVLFISPPGGLGSGIKRDLQFIDDRHSIRLLDPFDTIKDENSGYFEWAVQEWQARLIVGVIVWALITTILFLWARKKGRQDDAPNVITVPAGETEELLQKVMLTLARLEEQYHHDKLPDKPFESDAQFWDISLSHSPEEGVESLQIIKDQFMDKKFKLNTRYGIRSIPLSDILKYLDNPDHIEEDISKGFEEAVKACE